MITVGITYDRVKWEEKALLKAIKKRNLQPRLVDSKEIYLDTLEEPEEVRSTFGDIVVQRCISHFRGLHLAAILESKGLTVINPFKVSEVCGNKLYTTLALIKAGVPVPKTLIAFTEKGALKALDALGYPAVLKPVSGSWGRLIALVKSREAAQAIIEAREEIRNALLQIYYFQEYVERPPRDIRTLVVGDEVVAAAYRYSRVGEWRTNVARGGVSKACPLTDELKEIAFRAAEAVGGGVLAVDCMESPEGLLVHEVNGRAEFRGLSSATKIDIADKIIDYVVEVAKK
ncbi:lysine biosynthesis protein LysX [Candidatus Bathyarchaeota archaeon ex4484_40]|nr:MAG: lysine biosynthesis protein LysX [Candidatus Bathyarchaeota archaeon ex4484_40]RJS67686.1 MAG: lysine biosynthesis protein LysX [Candidatus Bathyarchaeota archaeon]